MLSRGNPRVDSINIRNCGTGEAIPWILYDADRQQCQATTGDWRLMAPFTHCATQERHCCAKEVSYGGDT